MAKYDRLTTFLKGLEIASRRMGFAEIENILEFSLPSSARRHQAWWANTPIEGRQSMAWLSAGWKTEDPDLNGEAVTFRRSDHAGVMNPSTGPSACRPSAPTTGVDFMQLPDAPDGGIAIEATMQWKQLGAVTLDHAGKLSFPAAPTVPALYRFRLTDAQATRHYIGEAVDLRRRFTHYRNPGPDQPTNIRINEIIRKHLAAGGEVPVDVIATGITLSIGGKTVTVDLADKAVRRLLEQAAVVANAAIKIDSLNR